MNQKVSFSYFFLYFKCFIYKIVKNCLAAEKTAPVPAKRGKQKKVVEEPEAEDEKLMDVDEDEEDKEENNSGN